MIEFRNVSKTFRWKKGSIQALDNINLTIDDGEIYGIVGFSGAGKSTLVRMINGLEKPSNGEVIVNGEKLRNLSTSELRKTRKKIGMIFQQFNLLDSKTVYENIAMPLILNKEKKEVIEKRVKDLLGFVELSDKMHAYPSQLSGGQKQRVGIARALATNPDILLCDEATSALDPKTTDAILDLLKKINEDLKITIVIITHEMHVIQKICDKVAMMEKGRIIENGSVQEVFSNPVENITKGFINMVVKEDVPKSILQNMKKYGDDSQIWSIKYWGENQTLSMADALKQGTKSNVKIVYSTSNTLQESVLNILVVSVENKMDQTDKIREIMAPYQVILERKYYEN